MYDPQTGRFTQEDPLGLAGGLNAYGFASGDPVNFGEPVGLCPHKIDADCTVGTGIPSIATSIVDAGGSAGASLTSFLLSASASLLQVQYQLHQSVTEPPSTALSRSTEQRAFRKRQKQSRWQERSTAADWAGMVWNNRVRSLKIASEEKQVRAAYFRDLSRRRSMKIRVPLIPRARARALAVLLCCCVAGCPQRTAVWVAKDSRSEHLVLRIGKSRESDDSVAIGVVRVYGCQAPATGGGAMWVTGPSSGTANVRELVYGHPPDGFSTDQGPKTLVPGCYFVDISGTGKTAFTVSNSGEITERDR